MKTNKLTINPKVCMTLGLASLFTGCAIAPNTVRIEAAHYSHLTAGWPLEKQTHSEDGLSTLQIVGRWQGYSGTYIEIGEGVNLEGRNGGGFYGPREVTSIKVGKEFRVRP